KVVRVDPDTGVVIDFMVNRDPSGPASYTGTAGLERPISAKFSPDGSELYVVDFGVMTMSEQGPAPRVGTGVVWRVVPAGGGAPCAAAGPASERLRPSWQRPRWSWQAAAPRTAESLWVRRRLSTPRRKLTGAPSSTGTAASAIREEPRVWPRASTTNRCPAGW